MERVANISIGVHRDTPRIYLQGKWIVDNGFQPGSKITVQFSKDCITITPGSGRTVSAKQDGKVGVIDINSPEIRQAFESAQKLTVTATAGTITITKALTVAKRAARVLTTACVAICAGGGLLSQAASQAGFNTVAAVEIEEGYANIYQHNHGGRMYNMSVEEVPWDDIARLGPIGLLEMGIPCEPFSAIRRLDKGGQEKRDKSLPPEAHAHGDLTFWALLAVDRLNPHTCIFEEVPGYLESGAYYILHHALERMGYTVAAQILNPVDYGSLTGRKRAVIIATTFDTVQWPLKFSLPRTLGEILEAIPDDSPEWFDRVSKAWVFNHWESQTAKGNGFEPPKLTAQSASCPTIKKRYFAGQGDNPVVAHPTKPGVCRWLTLTEVKRLMGVPESYYLGESKTTAGEILGQGVQVEMFTKVIKAVTRV